VINGVEIAPNTYQFSVDRDYYIEKIGWTMSDEKIEDIKYMSTVLVIERKFASDMQTWEDTII
jgi:hypothetical protein